jgi:ABC-type branched-subunit amino acid transport system ATPase component
MSLLEIRGLTKRFFGLTAVDNVDINIERGELVSLIGPNGSGKTTLFNCITGFMEADEGRVYYKDRDITDTPPHEIALLGITRTFQLARIFRKLTVLENLVMAVQQHQADSTLDRILRTKKASRLEREATERAEELMDFVGLTHLRDEPAHNLSYGQYKLLIFAAGLMPDPDILLLDEPAAAINPTMINAMKEHIVSLNKAGKTIFFIEHNMEVVMDVCERIIVLDAGRKIAEGPPEAIRDNERVIEINELFSGYEEIEVLKGVSLQIKKREIASIIGANGAGKSTLLKTVFGLVKAREGSIVFDGQGITNRMPTEILRLGLSYVPQGRCNFPAMSVQDNLEMGAFIRTDKEVTNDIESMFERFPILKDRRGVMAGNLSGGEQQVLEMAMALLLHPKLIMIDEPSLGLAPQLVELVFEAILRINAEGTTIMMVEQNTKKALSVSDHGIVLVLGEKGFEGTGQEILNNEEVKRHYLGG